MMQPSHSRRLAVALAGVFAASGALCPPVVFSPVFAQDKNASTAQRFATSSETQAAMMTIRNLVANNHSLVTHRRMPRKTALSMHASVHQAIKEIRAENTGESDAVDAIQEILRRLEQGVNAVAGKDTEIGPIEGIVMMDEALAKYSEHFDHPGWKGPREL